MLGKTSIMKIPSETSSYVSDSSSKRDSCSCLPKFHKLLSSQFYNFGYLIAKSPSYFIIIPVFLTLLCVTGFQTMNYIKDPEFLFAPAHGRGKVEREIVEDVFPVNYSSSFDPSRISRLSSFSRLLVSAKDNETMLRSDIWASLLRVDEAVRNLTVEWQDDTYRYEDICAKFNFQCIGNPVLALEEIIPFVENGTTYVDYPIMLFPFVVPFFYGGVEVNETEGILLSVKSISLTYWFKEDDWRQRERSHSFEQKILKLMDEVEFEGLTVVRFVSMSLEDELDTNTISVLKFLPPTVIVMLAFSFVSILVTDWVRSKVQIAMMGVVTAGMAVGCSFGMLMYCNIPFIGINVAAPFLVLGIGIDDMFVILSAWHRSNIQDDVPKRLAETYGEAAVSITITSVTNMISFFIGAITPFPSVYIFCIYTGVSIMMTYLFCISFFGGCLALAGYQEKSQRHSLSCKPVLSKSQAEERGFWYTFCCAGGINKKDPFNSKDNEAHSIMVFFRDYYAKMLNYNPMKAFIIFIFLMYLAGAIYGCMNMHEGLEKRKLAKDSSYLIDYYDLEDSSFRKFPYRIQVVIHENLTYSDPKVQKQMFDLHKNFENLTCIGPKLYTQSWFRGFHKFLARRPALTKQIVDEESYIRILRKEFLIPEAPEFLDLKFNENFTQILSSRFIIQSYEILDTNDDRDMMEAVRKAAEEAPFDVIAYNPFFVLFDQFLLVTPLTIQTISLVAIVMMVVSLLFIPNPLCSLWVIFSIISIEIGVMGYMSLWGVNLDCISMINLIMCIGFSVDFSAHISYAYLTANVDTPAQRVEECMYSLGLPIVQSGLSTIAGVSVFVFAPSYIFQTFFKVICLVIIFGSMHALLLLPVMLSLLGPGSCSGSSKPKSLSKTIQSANASVPQESKASNNVYLQNISPIIDEDSVSDSRRSSVEDVIVDRKNFSYETSDAGDATETTSTLSKSSKENLGMNNLSFVCDSQNDYKT